MTENKPSARQYGGARDATDEKLIALLGENARMTLTALAQKLGLSRTAVQARMSRLERDRVIVGYRAVLGERVDAGSDSLGAVLSLTFSQRPCAPVVRKFRHWSEVTHYWSVTGAQDGYMIVRVADALDLSRLVDRLSGVEGVSTVSSAVILKSDFD